MKNVSRRRFLKILGGAGLGLSFSSKGICAVLGKNEFLNEKPGPFRPNGWLFVCEDESIYIFCSQCEIGQGVLTVLPSIVADELEADWEKVKVLKAPFSRFYEDPIWEGQVTAGSASVRHFYMPLRRAGATARMMLISAAARHWNCKESECKAQKGHIIHMPTNRRISYGRLVRTARTLPVPKKIELKGEKDFRYIGSSLPRIDARAKINGSAVYGLDVRLPDMRYSILIRPPRFGAGLLALSPGRAKKFPGIESIFTIGNKVAVIGRDIPSVLKAKEEIEIKWGRGRDDSFDNEKIGLFLKRALNQKGTVKTKRGDWKGGLRSSRVIHKAEYFLPYLAHAQMEPLNCTVLFSGKSCSIWTSCQNKSDIMAVAKGITGLSEKDIKINITFVGGSFGRRFEVDYVKEALEVALKARLGRPIKLFWTREDDFKNDFYRPANCARIIGGCDSNGLIRSWIHKVAAPSVYERIEPSLLKGGIDPSAVESIHNSSYNFKNLFLEYVWMKDMPPPCGFWRSVGNSHNSFTVESFIDELSFKAGIDPLEFRIKNLRNSPRAKRVLELVAKNLCWEKGPRKGRAFGISQHYLVYTYIALGAEVSVDESSGKTVVHRIVSAVDCGRAVNKAVVKEQIEGGILFGLSAALKEEVGFSEGGTSTKNFFDYPVLTMSETPPVEVYLVESGEKPTGVGEVGTAPVAPAIANAVFRAVGIRIRQLPLTPQRVLAHLENKRNGNI